MITPEMQAVIGKELSRAVSCPISANEISKWALAVYYPALPPAIFWNDEAAAASQFGGLVAPEDFNPFAWITKLPGPKEHTQPQGHGRFEEEVGVPSPDFRAVLQVGVKVQYTGVRMRPGDVITEARSIREYFEREGRMGLQLYTTVTTIYTNQNDEVIKTLDTNFVRYR
jgi:hypothetical protein